MYGANPFGWLYFGEAYFDPDAATPPEGPQFPAINNPGAVSETGQRRVGSRTVRREVRETD